MKSKILFKTLKIQTVLIALIIFLSQNTFATNWTTKANGSWTSTSTWVGSKVPSLSGHSAPYDTIFIKHNVSLSNGFELNSAILIIDAGKTLTNSKAFTLIGNSQVINAGTLSVSELIVDYSNTSILNNGTISITKSSGNGFKINTGIVTNNFKIISVSPIYNKGTLINNGLLQSTSITNTGTLTNFDSILTSSYFTNDWGGVLTTKAGSTMKITGSTTIRNSSTLEGSLTTNNLTIDNSSSINNSGTALVSGNFTDNGTLTNSGSITVMGTSLISWGDVINNTGLVYFAGNVTNQGVIQNDGQLLVDGTLKNTSGSILGAGDLCSNSGSAPTISGSAGINTNQLCGSESSNLPVQIVEFNAASTGSDIIIAWTTASEVNNEYFEVMVSTNGINFERIGLVQGNGNSNVVLNYSFTHVNAQSGSLYYMLVQHDFDGKTQNSKIINAQHNSSLEAKLYPNPAQIGQVISIELSSDNHSEIRMMDASGKIILSTVSNESKIELNTNDLPIGFYVVQIIQNDQLIQKKINIIR